MSWPRTPLTVRSFFAASALVALRAVAREHIVDIVGQAKAFDAAVASKVASTSTSPSPCNVVDHDHEDVSVNASIGIARR